MDYRFSVKALPQDPAAQDQDPAAEQPPAHQPPHQDDARPWAGDAYDEGDESDPGQAFAAFSGQSGEQAWLDKAEDGTLTGWVRDVDGQVYRYSDPDAWAIDVDDAGMAQTGGTGAQPGAGGQPAPGGAAPADPNADLEAADPNVSPAAADPYAAPEEEGSEEGDPYADDGSGLSLDYGTSDEAVPSDEDPGQHEEENDDEDQEEPDGEDDGSKGGKKRKPWQ
ncbi:hypothetical protein AB0G49_13915 [Streptomyces longwoodensis]|uniref:hypothetical protein n=1 Tax=Streptomyces longwoodensis TaxID=68231 RepID=UPI0033D77181